MRAYCLPVKPAADSRVATSLRLAAVPFYAPAALGVAITLWGHPPWSELCVLVGLLTLTQTARALGLRWPTPRQLLRSPRRRFNVVPQLRCVAVLERAAAGYPCGPGTSGPACDWPSASRAQQPIRTHDCRAAPREYEDLRINSRGGAKSRSMAITSVSGRVRCQGKERPIDVVLNRPGDADSNRRGRLSGFSAAQQQACNLMEINGNLLRSIAQLEHSAHRLHKMTEMAERLRPVQFDHSLREDGAHSPARLPVAQAGRLELPKEPLGRSTDPTCPCTANAFVSPRNLSDPTARDALNGRCGAAVSRSWGAATDRGEPFTPNASARSGSMARSARVPRQ